MKIRILTYHFITNNGAAMFSYCLYNALRRILPEAEIQFVNYTPLRLWAFEFLKRFKISRELRSFYRQRAKTFIKFMREELPLGKKFPILTSRKKLFRQLVKEGTDCVIVGMDVWCIISGTERPVFPNAYWLSDFPVRKIAYAVSGYNSNSAEIKKHAQRISDLIKNFDLIAVRDEFTQQFVSTLNPERSLQIQKIPDPTFFYQPVLAGLKEKLERLGVDLSQPLLGLLIYGEDTIVKTICDLYRIRGFQIIALSMFNRNADINLGHVLSPLEWAGAFHYLDFCVTNRFHGSIFSLINQIPFLSLQTEKLESASNSKIYDLLCGFGLQDCYLNANESAFSTNMLIDQMDMIQSRWETELKSIVQAGLPQMREESQMFLEQVKALLGEN